MPASQETQNRAIEVLARFGELLASAAEPEAVMRELASTAVGSLAAKAAVIVAVGADGSAFVGAKAGLQGDCAGFPGDVDIDASLADDLRAHCPEIANDHIIAFMLASGGDLFGVALFAFDKASAFEDHHMRLARAIASLAASGLSQAARYAQLSRSYAELRASREVLERSQKLRALGEMAAGVSHDLKNILNPLSLHLQFIERGLPKDATDARESVAEMKGVLSRGLQTIERLREFSRQAPSGKAEDVDPNALVAEALSITRPRLRSTRHDVHYRVVEELGTTKAICVQTADAVAALVNLVVNAVDAMPNGGTITLTTGANEDGAFIRVADDGPGMPPEIEARVFEPFFTTKGQEGTGLGLAMVYAFVQRSHGRIALTTAPGKGAAFTLTFPPAHRS
ncbi:MAG: sensor histidine kinase [Polyangiales bacterium]